jgi:hypothetical protein
VEKGSTVAVWLQLDCNIQEWFWFFELSPFFAGVSREMLRGGSFRCKWLSSQEFDAPQARLSTKFSTALWNLAGC